MQYVREFISKDGKIASTEDAIEKRRRLWQKQLWRAYRRRKCQARWHRHGPRYHPSRSREMQRQITVLCGKVMSSKIK